MPFAVETEELTKHYQMGHGIVRALDGVTLRVERGEFLGLVGTSGSGKSTLLNLVAGLDHPTSGSIKVFDRSLGEMSREALSLHRRKNVGMIFQSFNLIPTMTARDNVALALTFAEVPRAQRDDRARELLEQVGLADRRLHRPKELSGGEQQRVSIARALANNPEILLADEPTGNLDSQTAREILALLRDLNSSASRTVIMVTHDLALASACAGRTITLLDGKIVAEART
jgi:putative ABC transport system ATP-binding protein